VKEMDQAGHKETSVRAQRLMSHILASIQRFFVSFILWLAS
jgi:hypothetical protein